MSGETVEWGAEVAPGDIRLVPPEWVSEAKRPRSQGVPLPLYKRKVVRTEWEPAEVYDKWKANKHDEIASYYPVSDS